MVNDSPKREFCLNGCVKHASGKQKQKIPICTTLPMKSYKILANVNMVVYLDIDKQLLF